MTPDRSGREDRHHLAGRARKRERDRRRGYREDDPSRPAGQCPRHRDHCSRDDGGRGELEAVHPACPFEVDASGPEGERRQDHRRGQREPEPGRKPAELAGSVDADRDPELARGRSGQEIRERDELAELPLVRASWRRATYSSRK